MGFTKNLFYLSVVAVLGGVLLNKYAPEYKPPLIKNFHPVRDTINIIKQYYTSIYPIEDKTPSEKTEEVVIFTPDDLKKYSGKEGEEGLYLAFLGVVYDVEKGRRHYGPNSSYSIFAGKDATRSYITGEYTKEGLTDDISDLSPSEYLRIIEWNTVYQRDYKAVGKVIGKYYDEHGNPTPYHKEVDKIFENVKGQVKLEEEEKIQFPPCNSEYNMDLGSSKVYCSSNSGGKSRGWAGVPRKLLILGSKRERCACVKNFGESALAPKEEGDSSESDTKTGRGDLDHPNIREYPNCEPDEDTCYLKRNDKA